MVEEPEVEVDSVDEDAVGTEVEVEVDLEEDEVVEVKRIVSYK